jgi:hypothetical protein
LYKDVSLKSEVVPLPPAFVRWLKQDKVSLPPGTPSSLFCTDKARRGAAASDSDDEWSDSPMSPRSGVAATSKAGKVGSDNDDDEGDDDDEFARGQTPAAAAAADAAADEEVFDFTALDEAVRAAVGRLYGNPIDAASKAGLGFFAKLNWSAPQDAAWLNMGSLKCQQPGDAYLLIKVSTETSNRQLKPRLRIEASAPNPYFDPSTNVNSRHHIQAQNFAYSQKGERLLRARFALSVRRLQRRKQKQQ